MNEPVPYIVYEGEQARSERYIKRLIIALIVSILLIFASNALWLYAWMQYDYESETVAHVVDADNGIANYIGGNGDISNGESDSQENYSEQNSEGQSW